MRAMGIVILTNTAANSGVLEIDTSSGSANLPDEEDELIREELERRRAAAEHDAWLRWARKIGISMGEERIRERELRLLERRRPRARPHYHRRMRARSLSTRLSKP
jgi:hypothetical protein